MRGGCRLAATILALALVVPGAGAPDRAAAAGGEVRGCQPFVISKSHDDHGVHRFRAWHVRRSAHLRCSMVRKLIKAAYGTGPLKVIRTVYGSGGSGRPTYWLKNGWRCGTGAGGAGCFNAKHPVFNTIEGMAVLASTG